MKSNHKIDNNASELTHNTSCIETDYSEVLIQSDKYWK